MYPQIKALLSSLSPIMSHIELDERGAIVKLTTEAKEILDKIGAAVGFERPKGLAQDPTTGLWSVPMEADAVLQFITSAQQGEQSPSEIIVRQAKAVEARGGITVPGYKAVDFVRRTLDGTEAKLDSESYEVLCKMQPDPKIQQSMRAQGPVRNYWAPIPYSVYAEFYAMAEPSDKTFGETITRLFNKATARKAQAKA